MAPNDDVLSAARTFYDVAMAWHGKQPARACASDSIAAKALHLHAMNFHLWHHEDAARRPGASDHEVASRKRRIDELNDQRSRAIEDIDVTLIEWVKPREDAPLHTETPGSMVDRLSVLTLRILHARSHLAVLEGQYDDLFGGLEQFLTRLQRGEASFKLYRQFKSVSERSYCALFET
jgi:hypothetical protein